tara:strand:- start:19502 stop:20404 length:903 start_codon:yes stop_codon:yes gene_type:complete
MDGTFMDVLRKEGHTERAREQTRMKEEYDARQERERERKNAQRQGRVDNVRKLLISYARTDDVANKDTAKFLKKFMDDYERQINNLTNSIEDVRRGETFDAFKPVELRPIFRDVEEVDESRAEVAQLLGSRRIETFREYGGRDADELMMGILDDIPNQDMIVGRLTGAEYRNIRESMQSIKEVQNTIGGVINAAMENPDNIDTVLNAVKEASIILEEIREIEEDKEISEDEKEAILMDLVYKRRYGPETLTRFISDSYRNLSERGDEEAKDAMLKLLDLIEDVRDYTFTREGREYAINLT